MSNIMTEEQTRLHFEDIEDMMDHSFEKIEDAVYYYVLCAKMVLSDLDKESIKALLMQSVGEQFDDVYKRMVPYIKQVGNETIFYGLLKTDL